MKVLFITDGPTNPGSRYRCIQFFPYLEARGISCDVLFAYDERYNALVQTHWSKPYRFFGRIQRTAGMLTARGYDLLYLHKTALAFTGLPEQLRSIMPTPLVFDFDDALHLGPGGGESRLRNSAFRKIVAVADTLVPGNDYLAMVAGAPDKTTVIPTVVDTAIYQPGVARVVNRFIAGWIGTSGNFPYLRAVLPQVLKALENVDGGRLHIVSNAPLVDYADHPLVLQTPWCPETEVESLQTFDVGLMPLPNTDSTRGKCGFKLLQYLSVGIPVLASAVGANIEIMNGHSVGCLLGPDDDWGAAISSLASDPLVRARLGEQGRRHVEDIYSIRAVLPRLETVLRSTAERGTPPRKHARNAWA